MLFPEVGVTKGDLFEYYGEVAPAILPHLRRRPFTMKRIPMGAGTPAYFQKQAPKGMPSWIPTRQFRTVQRSGESRLVVERSRIATVVVAKAEEPAAK